MKKTIHSIRQYICSYVHSTFKTSGFLTAVWILSVIQPYGSAWELVPQWPGCKGECLTPHVITWYISNQQDTLCRWPSSPFWNIHIKTFRYICRSCLFNNWFIDTHQGTKSNPLWYAKPVMWLQSMHRSYVLMVGDSQEKSSCIMLYMLQSQ